MDILTNNSHKAINGSAGTACSSSDNSDSTPLLSASHKAYGTDKPRNDNLDSSSNNSIARPAACALDLSDCSEMSSVVGMSCCFLFLCKHICNKGNIGCCNVLLSFVTISC